MTGLEWHQLAGQLRELGQSMPALPMACYSLGIVALILVLRRSVRRRSAAATELLCLNTRSLKAHDDIDDIAARQWLASYAMALKIPMDGSAPAAADLDALRRLSDAQSGRRRS